MSQTVVLDLPEETLARYQKGAAAARKPLEEFLVDCLREVAPPYGAVALKSHGDPSRGKTRESRSLPSAEAQLLQQINTGFDEEEWSLYRALIARRRVGTLQPDEQQELIRLTDRLEQANARRIGALAELAQIRQIDLDELMDELGIQSPGYE